MVGADRWPPAAAGARYWSRHVGRRAHLEVRHGHAVALAMGKTGLRACAARGAGKRARRSRYDAQAAARNVLARPTLSRRGGAHSGRTIGPVLRCVRASGSVRGCVLGFTTASDAPLALITEFQPSTRTPPCPKMLEAGPCGCRRSRPSGPTTPATVGGRRFLAHLDPGGRQVATTIGDGPDERRGEGRTASSMASATLPAASRGDACCDVRAVIRGRSEACKPSASLRHVDAGGAPLLMRICRRISPESSRQRRCLAKRAIEAQ